MKKLETLARVGILSTILSSPLAAESPGTAILRGIVGAAISGAADEAGRTATQEAVKELKKTPIPTPTPIAKIPQREPLFCVAYERKEDLNRDSKFDYPSEFFGIGTKFFEDRGLELSYFNDFCPQNGETITETLIGPTNKVILNRQGSMFPKKMISTYISPENLKEFTSTYGTGTYTWIVQSPTSSATSIRFEIARSSNLERVLETEKDRPAPQKSPQFLTFTRWRDINQDKKIQPEELWGSEQKMITKNSEFNFAWNNYSDRSQDVTFGIYTDSGDLISEKAMSVPPQSTAILNRQTTPLRELFLQQPGTYTIIGCVKEGTPYRFDISLKEE